MALSTAYERSRRKQRLAFNLPCTMRQRPCGHWIRTRCHSSGDCPLRSAANTHIFRCCRQSPIFQIFRVCFRHTFRRRLPTTARVIRPNSLSPASLRSPSTITPRRPSFQVSTSRDPLPGARQLMRRDVGRMCHAFDSLSKPAFFASERRWHRMERADYATLTPLQRQKLNSVHAQYHCDG